MKDPEAIRISDILFFWTKHWPFNLTPPTKKRILSCRAKLIMKGFDVPIIKSQFILNCFYLISSTFDDFSWVENMQNNNDICYRTLLQALVLLTEKWKWPVTNVFCVIRNTALTNQALNAKMVASNVFLLRIKSSRNLLERNK